MHLAWSQAEEAWRDTLTHKAERSALVEQCKLHDLPWFRNIVETSMRRILAYAAYSRRDLFKTLFYCTEAALSQYDEVFTVGTISTAPGGQKQLHRANGWGYEHVNRFVRIGDKLYWSVGLYNTDTYLRLSPYETDYWDAPAWEESVGLVAVTEEVRILPFRIYERSPGPSYDGWNDETYNGPPCLVEIVVLPYVASVPETFLLEPTEYLTATQGDCPVYGGDVCGPTGVPEGGYLLETDVDDFPFGHDVAYPVYLFDNQVSPSMEQLLNKFRAAGVRVVLRLSVSDAP
jgi:hypothetical protein